MRLAELEDGSGMLLIWICFHRGVFYEMNLESVTIILLVVHIICTANNPVLFLYPKKCMGASHLPAIHTYSYKNHNRKPENV